MCLRPCVGSILVFLSSACHQMGPSSNALHEYRHDYGHIIDSFECLWRVCLFWIYTWKGHTRSFVTDIDIFAWIKRHTSILCTHEMSHKYGSANIILSNLESSLSLSRDLGATSLRRRLLDQNGLCNLKEGRNCRFLNGSHLNGRIHGKGHESKVSFKVRKNVGYN